jgi:hypothetical protein
MRDMTKLVQPMNLRTSDTTSRRSIRGRDLMRGTLRTNFRKARNMRDMTTAVGRIPTSEEMRSLTM